jgi:hypothetical protein
MIFWMVGVITLSIVLVFLIHQIYEYLKRSFSKPLERNIVNDTKIHYEQIYNTLATSKTVIPTEIYSQPIYSHLQPQPQHQQAENMADELMNFMSDLDEVQQDLDV